MAALAGAGLVMNPEVIVIGGGPAGLSAGIALAHHGISVMVCEAASDPDNKPCGEGLLPRGLRELCLLGLDETELLAAGRPLVGVRYTSAAGVGAEGRFGDGVGLGLPRSALRRSLLALAARKPLLHVAHAEARVLPQASGTCSVRIDGSCFTPRLIVAADGLHSRARKAAALPSKRPTPFRYGARQHYRIRPWSDQVEVYWSQHAEAYVTPTSHDEINVALLWQPKHRSELMPRREGVPDLFGTFPQLAERLAGAEPALDTRGYGPLHVDVPAPARRGLVLLGDAAGYVDALTGEGVGLAVAKARALARILAPALRASSGQLSLRQLKPYLAAAHQLERHHLTLTRLLLRLRRAPWLLERAIAALSEDPRLFSHLLRANQGAGSPFWVPPRSLIGLLRHLVGAPPRCATK
ncbi:MAG TPA: NAD(P)/FAD-dependent oxidoreductase [Polyangiaceae bacterium]|nr:NAD(P)/FAD-dependent oxidoreductase [Polyangiaceae bacterium]